MGESGTHNAHTEARGRLTMRFQTDVNEGALRAMLAGTKMVEVRTNCPTDPVDWSQVRPGDVLEFDTWPAKSDLRMRVTVKAVRHYADARSLYETEGLDRTMSSGMTEVAAAVEIIHSFPGYDEGIAAHGLWAVEVGGAEQIAT